MTGNDKLKERVRERLREAGLTVNGLVIDVERRVIRLRGEIADARTKDAIERAISTIDGAAGVRSDLRVRSDDFGDEHGAMKSEFGKNPAAELARSQKFDRIP